MIKFRNNYSLSPISHFRIPNPQRGFTIVELIVVIVVIGILATITFVSYGAIQSRAATETLKLDIQKASSQIALYKANTGGYPATGAEVDDGKGLSKSADTTYQYTAFDDYYCLGATSTKAGASTFYTSSSNNGAVATGTCSKVWKQISGGAANTCAIASNNLAYCWGDNGGGQLGNNSTNQSKIPVAVYTTGILSGKTIKSISVGEMHTCAIASDDLVYCWGFNANGQLGDNKNSGEYSHTPVAVNTSTGVSALYNKTVKSIDAGYWHTCVIASDDQAYCWGYNNEGQLGNNSSTQSLVPVAVNTTGVLSGRTIKSISAGTYHTCVIASIVSDNQAYCWGQGGYGQLGNTPTANSLVPATVTNTGLLSGKTIISISAGGYQTCAIASDNLAYCWGSNWAGQLGINSNDPNRLVPAAVYVTGVLNGKTIKSITTGYAHTCAIASDNLAYCWGLNGNGQLGNNSTTASNAPVAVDITGVLAGKIITSIAFGSGSIHTCAISSDNLAYCWGDNGGYGKLGNNTLIVQSLIPVTVISP